MLINPLQPTEQAVKMMRVPANRDLILYFGVQALDTRGYTKPNFIVTFPPVFQVNFDVPYESLYFAKKPIKAKPNEVQFISERGPLKRGQLEYIAFPVIVKTPELVDTFNVRTEFVSESTKGKSKIETLTLEVRDDNFSQNEEYFDYQMSTGKKRKGFAVILGK
jgi:hypothetical protein